MTTDASRSSLASALLVGVGLALVAGGCSSGVGNRRGDQLDPSGYPPDIQQAYEVFAVRCSRCHSLARPLNARIRDEEHWVRYVARMRRQPGSGINRRNGDEILKFLMYYTRELQRADGDLIEDQVEPALPPEGRKEP